MVDDLFVTFFSFFLFIFIIFMMASSSFSRLDRRCFGNADFGVCLLFGACRTFDCEGKTTVNRVKRTKGENMARQGQNE